MIERTNQPGMLSPYRVLDLTNEKGVLCGKLLGDLGADVIKIEKPGGDSARNIGPFYKDEVHPEKSLFWFAFNTSKRGITLSIEKDKGRDIFKELAKNADFVVESFEPGYMDDLGLGYADLEKLNPGIIMVSISPFGQKGPYKNYKADDLVIWAMSGRMYSLGDGDRPPLQISHIMQTFLQGGLEAAAAATMALYYRQMSGEGQHIDLSIQAAAAQPGNTAWDTGRQIRPRPRLSRINNPRVPRRIRINRIWPCKDGGTISYSILGGRRGGVRIRPALVDWMINEGMANDYLKEFDWEAMDFQTIDQNTIDKLEAPTRNFFNSHTKAEILEGAVKYRIMFYPQFTTADILQDVQLTARDFWTNLEHPELGETIAYPGAFARFSERSPILSRRAPLIGEHNKEIYEQELKLSHEEIHKLKRDNII